MPPVQCTQWRLCTLLFIAERRAGIQRIPIFIVFGLARPRIEPESTALVLDVLSIRSLTNAVIAVLLKCC